MDKREIREKKRQARIAIMNIQDERCKGCKEVPRNNHGVCNVAAFEFCGTQCTFGKEILRLRAVVEAEGRNAEMAEERNWEQVVKQAMSMREGGMSYKKIADELGVGESTLYYHFAKKREDAGEPIQPRKAKVNAKVAKPKQKPMNDPVKAPEKIVPAPVATEVTDIQMYVDKLEAKDLDIAALREELYRLQEDFFHNNMSKKPVEPETTRRAKLIEVLETVSIRGNGVDTPVREVIQYWSKDGELLAEHDPCATL